MPKIISLCIPVIYVQYIITMYTKCGAWNVLLNETRCKYICFILSYYHYMTLYYIIWWPRSYRESIDNSYHWFLGECQSIPMVQEIPAINLCKILVLHFLNVRPSCNKAHKLSWSMSIRRTISPVWYIMVPGYWMLRLSSHDLT